jgi:hypothetical protein
MKSKTGDIMKMAKMTDKMQELFNKVRTVVIATATAEGKPNAVPVNAKKVIDDETILISDQYFNKTLANMRTNPQVSIMYWEGVKGYQLNGSVIIETSGQRYEDTARWIDEVSTKLGVPLKSKGAVIFKIEEIYDLSPGPNAGKQLA